MSFTDSYIAKWEKNPLLMASLKHPPSASLIIAQNYIFLHSIYHCNKITLKRRLSREVQQQEKGIMA